MINEVKFRVVCKHSLRKQLPQSEHFENACAIIRCKQYFLVDISMLLFDHIFKVIIIGKRSHKSCQSILIDLVFLTLKNAHYFFFSDVDQDFGNDGAEWDFV